jgi:serine/threonine-protein kinase
VSPATDVYAVGLLIYRTLIGQLPWDVGTTTALLRAHQYVEPDPLPPVEGLPPAVDALVCRCLEKHPSDRPSSAELAHVLAQLAAGAPMTTRGYVPDWAENAEDTTILPAQQSYPDVIRREPAPVEPSPPARNSRFADLPSGPVMVGASLRPAVGDERPTQEKKEKKDKKPTEHTRRILVAAGMVLLLGGATYAWSLTSNLTSSSARGATPPQPSVVPATGKCVVSYAVWSDANGQFKAQVTLANRADLPVDKWKLWFIMPGDQIVSGNGKSQLTQADRAITVASSAPLKPQTTLNVPITGRYQLNNTPPLAFMLNDRTCETFVSSKPGEPSRQVEHLSDGNVRLGPTASTSTTPVPGISIDPQGVVHITPTTAPPTTPATGSTTTPTATPTTDPTTTPTTTPTTVPPSLQPIQTTDPTTSPTTTTPTTEPTTPPPPSLEPCDVNDPTCTTSS